MDEDTVAREYMPKMKTLIRVMLRTRKSSTGMQHEFDEAMSAGMVGLVRAFRGYEPGRGAAFGTYADMMVRTAVIDHWRSESATVPVVPLDADTPEPSCRHRDAPGWATEYAEWVEWLSRKLPSRHGELIRLHYLDAGSAELNRCAARMGLKPGRAGEIHVEAIRLLRESFGRQPRESHRSGGLRGTARATIADAVRRVVSEGKTPSIPVVARVSGYSAGHVGNLRRPMIEAGEWPDVDGRKRAEVA